MFERTVALLHSGDVIQCDDSCFSFGYGTNEHGTNTMESLLAFFGQVFVASSIAGGGGRELTVTAQAMREIDPDDARRATLQLLQNDFRMFSFRQVTTAALLQVTTTFFDEMGDCRAYSNTHVNPRSHSGECLGPWSPVTRSSRDTLLCFVNEARLAYWVYSDDE